MGILKNMIYLLKSAIGDSDDDSYQHVSQFEFMGSIGQRSDWHLK